MDEGAGKLIPTGMSIPDGLTDEPRPHARKPIPRRTRRASLALALSRLEREHVALLLAICELEEPPRPEDDTPRAVREALLLLLRDDLRQAQHALSLAARGIYGACEECQRPLAARLLEQHPALTHCTACSGGRSAAPAAALD